MTESLADDRPRLILVAGPNGTGKTSVTEQLLAHTWMQGCLYINPDNIAQHEFSGWNDQSAILAAANEAQRRRENCLMNRTSFAFETVLSGVDKIDFLQRAKAAGYFIRLFFIGTDSPAINAKRIAMRVLNGGHDVPIAKIISRYSRSISHCIHAVALSDRAYIYDNSIDDSVPRLLFRVSDGTLIKTYANINPWAQPVYDHFVARPSL